MDASAQMFTMVKLSLTMLEGRMKKVAHIVQLKYDCDFPTATLKCCCLSTAEGGYTLL